MELNEFWGTDIPLIKTMHAAGFSYVKYIPADTLDLTHTVVAFACLDTELQPEEGFLIYNFDDYFYGASNV